MNGGLKLRALVFTISAREDPGAESVSSRGFPIDEVYKGTENESLPQTVGAEMFVYRADHQKERGAGPLPSNCCVVKFVSPKDDTGSA